MVTVIIQILLCAIYTAAYENLAFNKPAWQQDDWPGREVEWGAAKAVDGRYTDRSTRGNQCTISNGLQTTATWRVDLGSVVSISHIDIYYWTGNAPRLGQFSGQFAGFFLYVSNTTSKDDGHLCFHEIQTVPGTPIENQSINCSVHGRYVIYYNERRPGVTYPRYYSTYTNNDLCELEVYGCPDPSTYGLNCDRQCPDGCQERKCDVITGQCLGCIPGYEGLRCNQVCYVHTYGLECSQSCGNCSDGDTCHHVNGTCPRGCSVGVHGDKCQTPCDPGFYGKNCGQVCSENCNVTNRCNRFTGECDGGCKPGWKAPTCRKACGLGFYGENCGHVCSENCKETNRCNRFTGECDGGCIPGWKSPTCQEEALSSCPTCTTDCDTAIIISLVGSVLIVLIGSVVNFLMWKRNQPKTVKTRDNTKSEANAVRSTDRPSSSNRVQSPYADLGNLDQPNTYEELNQYAEVGGEI